MLQGLVFDFDGVILDTESVILATLREVYALHGAAFSEAHALSVVGHVDMAFDPWAGVPPHLPRAQLEADYHRAKQRHLAALRPLPGVLALLDDARAAGARLAVASNSDHPWVEGHLQRLGLRPYFSAVYCREDVARGKPAPDLYLAAAQALGLPPTRCAAVEDSPPGSEAARAAGLYTVVVPNPTTVHHSFPAAHRRLSSLEGVTWSTLCTWATAQPHARHVSS